MKKTLFCCLLANFLFFAFSAKAELFNLKEYKLNNGLQLIVIPNHKAPIAMHMLWYKVGAADEAIGKGGSAHLLEHLMFRGTKKIKGQEYNRIMEQNGAVSNAFTGQDSTAYHQFIDISRLELAMYLEADRMQNLNIDDESFETERQIVFQERKQMIENNPLYLFTEELQRSFWQNHPYSRPVTGTEEEIMSLTKKDLKRIYKKYRPDNAILIISGDIEPTQAYELAQKYYGQISAPEQPLQKNSLSPQTKMQTRFTMELPKLNISRIVRKYHAPSFTSSPEKIYPYIILSKYLGDSETSILHRILVEGQNLAINASCSYNFTPAEGGSFDFVLIPSKNNNIEALITEFDKILNNVSQSFTPQDLEKAKRQLLAGLIYTRDNPQNAAYIAGTLARAGMSGKDIENYDQNIKSVTLQQVKQALKELLQSSFVEGIALPEGENK